MIHFLTKLGKKSDFGFGTSYKDGLCPKLRKNPAKPKLGLTMVLMILMLIFKE